jgi:Zn-dependent metalloprotease
LRPAVTPIGVADAEQIFDQGFTSLPSTATMSQARAATVKAATTRYGAGSQQVNSTAAWEAVGVR